MQLGSIWDDLCVHANGAAIGAELHAAFGGVGFTGDRARRRMSKVVESVKWQHDTVRVRQARKEKKREGRTEANSVCCVSSCAVYCKSYCIPCFV